MMWRKDTLADVRLTHYHVNCAARPGAGDVYRRFEEWALHFVPVNWGLSCVVTPGATTANPVGAAAASH